MDSVITSSNIDGETLCKMTLVYNSLEKGWSVKKREKSYIFTKNHEGRKEVFSEEYLKRFMKGGLDIENLIVEKGS